MSTQNKQQKKKFLLALPILVLPFITLAFWALGGGGEASAATEQKSGLNIKLPDAHNNNGAMDKMAYYDQAAQDSIKRREQHAGDPYYKSDTANSLANSSTAFPGNPTVGTHIGSGFSYQDPNEAKVYDKLAALQKALNHPQGQNPPMQQPGYGYQQQAMNTADVDRLEKMMKAMQSPADSADPETAQLNGMLEKILDIQHPERIQEKLKEKESIRKGQVYPVTTTEAANRITSLEAKPATVNSSGFYGLDDSLAYQQDQNAIAAVVHEDQTLVNGATVKLRLTDDIIVNGNRIPKNSFVYGTAQLDGERLTIKISSLRYKKSIYPVQLSVFDIDGMDGIYIPGAISRDVAKQSADRSLQNIGLTTYDPSLGAQAMSAGIEATKTLLSEKVKLIKVFVKAGYSVLLRDEKQKQEGN